MNYISFEVGTEIIVFNLDDLSFKCFFYHFLVQKFRKEL